MKKSLLLLSVLMLVSCKMYAPGVRVAYPILFGSQADESTKDLYAIIDYSEADGWTKINKLTKGEKYEKKQLPLLSSDSGDRYIYWKFDNSIYRTQKNYGSPEIITIGKDGKTYTVQTLNEWNLKKTPADKNLQGVKITEKQFNEQRKLSSAAKKAYKDKTDKGVANIKKIDYKTEKDPIKKLNDGIELQKAMINDAKTKTGASVEELKFENDILKALETQKQNLIDKALLDEYQKNKTKADESIKSIKKIDFKSDKDPIKNLNDMLISQKSVISEKTKKGARKEELEFEEKVKTAIEDQIKKLQAEIDKVSKDKEDYIKDAKKSISDIEKIGKSPEIKDITKLQDEITKLQKRLEGQTAMIKKAGPSTAAYKLEQEKLVEKALGDKIKELKEKLAKMEKEAKKSYISKYYEILGLTEGTGEPELSRAKRSLLRTVELDRLTIGTKEYEQAEAKQKSITDAYDEITKYLKISKSAEKPAKPEAEDLTKYYQVLGLKKGITTAELRAKCFELKLKDENNPDIYKPNTNEFKKATENLEKINEASDKISNSLEQE